ncbi:MAG: SRPBCC family protein [Armatimonadota bacterium]
MQTVNSITICANPDLVYRTVADIQEWPKMLPHYRWVRGIDNRDLVFEMAAWRSFVPIKWTSLTRCDSKRRRIFFTHIGGLTRGMEVVWKINSGSNGTDVSIVHDLSGLKLPLIRLKIGKLITGRMFVEPVADRTLRYMKLWVENQPDVQL